MPRAKVIQPLYSVIAITLAEAEKLTRENFTLLL
jgi:hypothetical protein